MIKASTWQWDRYLRKTALIDTYNAHSSTPPADFPVPTTDTVETFDLTRTNYAPLFYRKVHLRGKFDLTKQLIVTNRTDVSGPGHLLFAPFHIKDSKYSVMVSRGFVPFADREPESWKQYDLPEEDVELIGVLQPSVESIRFGPENPEVGLDKPFATKFFYEEISKMAKQLPYPLLAGVYLQQLGGPPSGQFPSQYIRIEVPPSTHFGYTIEWAMLAVLTIIVGIVMQFLPPRRRRTAEVESQNPVVIHSILFAMTLLGSLACASHARADNLPDKLPPNVGIRQLLNTQIDTSVKLVDQDGSERTIQDLILPNRPLVIAPVYYRCPHLCGLTINGMIKSINDLKLQVGKDFEILAVSVDPKETSELAAEKAKNVYAELKNSPLASTGWRFLTGNEENVRKLMAQLGFDYAPDGDEIAHAAGLIVLTPVGRISRYFFGVEFPSDDLRYSLIEAGEGKIGNLLDHAFLYCFRFDPSKGKYTLVVWNITRLICWAVVLALSALLVTLRIRENER